MLPRTEFVYLIRLSNLTDDFSSCWVNGREGLSTCCILPLVVDKQLKHKNVSLQELHLEHLNMHLKQNRNHVIISVFQSTSCVTVICRPPPFELQVWPLAGVCLGIATPEVDLFSFADFREFFMCSYRAWKFQACRLQTMSENYYPPPPQHFV